MGLAAQERQSRIADIIRVEKKATVADLSIQFDTSHVTIRRDLSTLERQGLIYRTHGGAISGEKVTLEFSLRERMGKHLLEKQMIGKFCSNMIEEGDTIVLGPGTTTLQIAKHIKRRRSLTVLTNSLPIASELSSCNRMDVIVLGGSCEQNSFALVGPLIHKAIEGFHVDKAFLGGAGFSIGQGLTTSSFLLAEAGCLTATISEKVFAVVDHSKIDRALFATILPLAEMDGLITDQGINEEQKRAIEEAGIKVFVV